MQPASAPAEDESRVGAATAAAKLLPADSVMAEAGGEEEEEVKLSLTTHLGVTALEVI